MAKKISQLSQSTRNQTTIIYQRFEFENERNHRNHQFVGCAFTANCAEVNCQIWLKFHTDHCYRFLPRETKAHKGDSTVKETTLYIASTNAIATYLYNTAEILGVPQSIPNKSLITITLNGMVRKKTKTEMPASPLTRGLITVEEFEYFPLPYSWTLLQIYNKFELSFFTKNYFL